MSSSRYRPREDDPTYDREPPINPRQMEDACYAYLSTLPSGEKGTIQEAARRVFGPGPKNNEWPYGTVPFHVTQRALLSLTEQGRARFTHLHGWEKVST